MTLTPEDRQRIYEEEKREQQVRSSPEVHVELRKLAGDCYVTARVEATADRLPRVFVGAFGSRDEAAAEATGWALGWLRRLRQDP